MSGEPNTRMPNDGDLQTQGTQEQADPLDRDTVARKVGEWWKKSTTHLSKWRDEAIENYDFVAGHQWTDDEIATLKDQLRPVITFNRIGPMHDAVLGYEINGRQTIVAQARDASAEDAGAAYMETEAIRWLRDEAQAEDEESDAFSDTFTTGYGWTNSRMSYDDDPMGLVDHDRVDPLSMRYDPSARKRNLVDARYVIHGEWKDKAEAEAMWPDATFTQTPAQGATDPLDKTGGPVDVPENKFYTGTGTEQNDNNAGKVFVMEAQWWELTPYFMVLNPQSMQIEHLDEETHTQLQSMAQQAGRPLVSQKMRKRQYYRAFVSGSECLEAEEWPCPKFSYQCITGKRDRNNNTFYGLVRAMKDPQRWANKWLSQTLHIVNSNAKGGFLAEEGVFVDVELAEQKLAKPGPIIEVAQGRLAGLKELPTATLPTATFQLTQFAINSMRDTTGVNVELLGMTDRDQAGVLEAQRKQSAMTILAPMFDSLRRYRKNVGAVYLFYIQKYIPEGRLVRVVGDDGAKYVPLVKAPDTVTFDVIVDEAPTSPNQKEAVFASLMQVLPALLKAGVPLPPEIIEYIPGLPAPLVETLRKKAMEPNPEAEAAKKLEAAQKIADITKTAADAEKSQAQAQQLLMGARTDLMEATGQIVTMMQQFATGQMGQPQPTPDGGMPMGAPQQPMPMQAAPDQMGQMQQHAADIADFAHGRTAAQVGDLVGQMGPALQSIGEGLAQGLSQLGSEMRAGMEQQAQATAQQSQVLSMLAEEMGAEKELVRDPKTRQAVGVRKKPPQPMVM